MSILIDADKTLLFIHGIWHGAWCWTEEPFLKPFVTGKFRLEPFDLPFHGNLYRGCLSKLRLRMTGFGAYMKALERKIAQFPKPPILIGHSMGCLVIECVLNRMSGPLPPAIVLLAPTRPWIFRRSVWRFSLKHPIQALKCGPHLSMWPVIQTPALCQEMLLPENMPEAEVRRFHEQMSPESLLLMNRVLTGFVFPKYGRVPGVPALIIAGERDRAVTKAEVQSIATGLQAEFMSFDLPHDMMLVPEAGIVSEAIVKWLRDTVRY